MRVIPLLRTHFILAQFLVISFNSYHNINNTVPFYSIFITVTFIFFLQNCFFAEIFWNCLLLLTLVAFHLFLFWCCLPLLYSLVEVLVETRCTFFVRKYVWVVGPMVLKKMPTLVGVKMPMAKHIAQLFQPVIVRLCATVLKRTTDTDVKWLKLVNAMLRKGKHRNYIFLRIALAYIQFTIYSIQIGIIFQDWISKDLVYFSFFLLISYNKSPRVGFDIITRIYNVFQTLKHQVRKPPILIRY